MEILKNSWVDKYFLRYAPGTIFGAFFLSYLYFRRAEFGFSTDTAIDKVVLGVVFLLGGFLFAYISSAPILVFHTARALYLSKKHPGWLRWTLALGLLALVCIFYFIFRWLGLGFLLSLTASASVVAWISTGVLAVAAYMKRDAIYRFYVTLCRKRTNEKTGLVESYQTMREHGNAFSIIFWEVFFGNTLLAVMALRNEAGARFTLQHDTFIMVVITAAFLWVWPATVAWYVAGRIENDFIEDK